MWLSGLISEIITAQLLLHCHLNNKAFTAGHGYYEFSRRPIRARVPQGNLLGPVLFKALHNHKLLLNSLG